MENKILHIEGMTCVNCEKAIHKKLIKQKGIENVLVSYSNSTVIVEYDSNIITVEEIKDNIEQLDYIVLDGSKKNEKNKTLVLVGLLIVLLAIYLIVENTVGFDFIPMVDASMGYGMLFTIGVITSLHCVAMCGGINLSQSLTIETESTSNWEKLKPSIMYNFGRVVSYTIVGGIVGALGQVVSFTGSLKGVVSIFAGVFMVIMGVNMLNIVPSLIKVNIRMPSFILKLVLSFKTRSTPFYVGLINGLMPCGPLQSMQIYALGTGNVIEGALSMFFFALGTAPLMIMIGLISTFLSRNFTKQMMKVGSVLVLVLGLVMVNRGLNLSGISTDLGLFSKGPENIAIIQEDIQVVRTKLEAGRTYPTITVQKGIPVEWEISTTEKDLNGCNNPITLPNFKIEKELKQGKNTIVFLPEKEGRYVYTCWMGMISGTIVVEELL